MTAYLPYFLGALAGSGVLAIWYGLKAVRDREATAGRRRLGLVAVNVGIVFVAASLYLLSRGG